MLVSTLLHDNLGDWRLGGSLDGDSSIPDSLDTIGFYAADSAKP
jgi:hypothetical protein